MSAPEFHTKEPRLTYLLDATLRAAGVIHQSEFYRVQRLIVYLVGRAKGDDLDAGHDCNFTEHAIVEFVRPWSKCIGEFSLSVHRDAAKPFPRLSVELHSNAALASGPRMLHKTFIPANTKESNDGLTSRMVFQSSNLQSMV